MRFGGVPCLACTQVEVEAGQAFLASSESMRSGHDGPGDGSLMRQHGRTFDPAAAGRPSVAIRAGADGCGCGAATDVGAIPPCPSKAAARQAARKERESQWAALMAAEPKGDFHAPEDVEALRQAEASIGDLCLRSAPGFVPEEVREHAAGARVGSTVRREPARSLTPHLHACSPSLHDPCFSLAPCCAHRASA